METISKYHITNEELATELRYVEEAKADPAKFEVLYNKYYEGILRFIYQRLDDKETAFDLTSQVFLNALNHLHKYEFRGVPFASWLYRIARNELNQLFRSNKAQRTINIESVQVNELIDQMEEDHLAIYRDKLMDVIKDLPESDLQLIEMRYFEKRAFKEIAEILNITENNVKVKVYRVLERLKKMILKK